MQSSGGRLQIKRVWFCTDITARNLIQAFGTEYSLPKIGDKHPSFNGCVARDYAIEPVKGHNDLLMLSWTYEQVSPLPTTSPVFIPDVGPNEVDYVEVSSEIRAEFALLYRDGVDFPNEGDPGEPDFGNPDDPDNDIGGRPIDKKGNPVSRQRNIQELTVTETVQVPQWSRYGQYRFNRNASSFLGAAPGSVLYRGASVRRTGLSVYQVSHQFVFDEFFHLIQQPRVDQDGFPIVAEGEDHAESVYFVQPFPTKGTLDKISPNLSEL